MSQGRELFALEWVKGELLETLAEARQALEVYAEQGRDETRMRLCLTRMHQVHGTLVMLELPGVALLADYMERLAQGLLEAKVTDIDESCEVLMQGIIELPERLEHLQDGGEDSEHSVLGLVNRAAALLSLEPLLAGDTLDEHVSESALARFERIDGAGKIRRIRAAYQNVLLSVLKGESDARAIQTLRKVAVGLTRICSGAPAEALWEAFGVFVESLVGVERPLPAEVVKMLRRIDAEIRRFAQDGAEAFLAPVHKSLIQQLLDAAEIRRSGDETAQRLRDRARFGPALDEVALSGREALSSATVAVREELVHIKDQLDLYVRAEERQPEALLALADPLRKVASSCAVLGFESSRGVLLEQASQLEQLSRDGSLGVQPLLNVAASLVQVEDNLAGMGTTGSQGGELERLRSAAERQVLAESRSGLESVKQAIVDYVSAEFDASHLAMAPLQIFSVCGALEVADLKRPVAALSDCRAFIEEELLGYAGNPASVNWERLDRFADCISGIDYYLERLGEDTEVGAEDVIEVVERSLRGLGYEGRGAELGPPGDPEGGASEGGLPEPEAEAPSEEAVEADAAIAEEAPADAVLETELHVMPEEGPLADATDAVPDVDTERLETTEQEEQEEEQDTAPEAPAEQHASEEDQNAPSEQHVHAEEEADSEFDLSASHFDGLDETAAPEPEDAVDPEIVEVFREEVGEVLETIDRTLPAWQANAADEESRTEVRRAFHTLKGSGRLVGADQLGELAWSVENMLNRVLDGTIAASDELFEVARQARALTPSLLDAFVNGARAEGEPVQQLMERADILASGGSLAPEAETPGLSDELTIFVEEAQQIIEVLKARTGRRRVQLDDEAMMALHTLVGSASLVQQEHIEQLSDALYETARAFQAEALRGPNIEVEIARLFQDAIAYMEQAVVRTLNGETAEPCDDLMERARGMLASADETPAEEMLVGLTQLETVINASGRIDAWCGGEDGTEFREQFIAAMQAIVGATFRPQVTDLAKALTTAVTEQAPDQALAERAGNVLKQGCERLLATVDAIAADRALPRVDDIVTALCDLADGVEPVAELTSAPVERPETRPAPAPVIAPTPEPVAQAPASQTEDDVDPELAEVFFEEAEELMEALEATLSEWSDERDNRLHLENLLRVLHTLKGGARLAGLARAGDEVHQFESFLIDAQNEEIPVDDDLFERSETKYESVAALLASTHQQIFAPAEAVSAASPVPVPVSEPSQEPEHAVALREREPVREVPGKAPAPAAVPTSIVETRPGQEMVRVRSALLENLVNLAGENSILRARVEQGMSDFAAALGEMETTIERTREQLRRLEIETEAQVLSRQERLDPRDDAFDPLEMDRYSQLQQLSRALSESASDMLDLKDTLLFKSREAETLLLQQARINTELQEGLMRTRMVPFSRLLPRLRRTVRQISTELGKDVEFHAYNAEGELDRNLLERMVPPLEHMLRNAVDHGIEPGDVRRNFGKAPGGRIDLHLSREGGDIVIEIADDGAGIDVEAVRTKATEKGLMHPDAELSDEEVLEFVLAAGFSTAKAVTQISGRGVGLDVVNSEVKQLGGSVSISSTPGKGTRFVVRVPFTVSVNRALMVSVGEDHYAIPLNTIEGIVLLDPEHVESLHKSADTTFDYAGVSYRVRYLGNYIGRPYTAVQGSGNVPVVLVRSGDQSIAVHVDSVQGSREIVVKSLGPQFAGVGGISGATILGDGSVVVILDLLALIRAYGREGFVATKPVLEHARPNPCVMVVDDSVTVRKVTARLLERQGMDVLIAKDGVEAVALLQERRPDVMLLDIEMPRMDGFEVARQVRHDDQLADLPIIMISSRTGSKHTDHAEELGVNRFLGKPFQENELLGAIDELVGARVGGQAS